MNIIESSLDTPSKLVQFYNDFVNMIKTAIYALNTFYNMLVEFDNRIVAMVNNCGSTEFDGFPVNKAIATVHYVVGDVIFYLLYMVILFGCLFTIYKLVWLIIDCIVNFITQLKGGTLSTVSFSSLIGKIFK